MNNAFWIGLLFSIPLSIFANLVTPRVQRWWDSKSEQRASARTKDLRAEYQQVKLFRSSRDEFHEFLLWVIIRTTFVGAVLGIVAGIAFLIPEVFDSVWIGYDTTMGLRVFRSTFYVISQTISIIGTLLIVNICKNALSIYSKVRAFDEYEASVREYISV